MYAPLEEGVATRRRCGFRRLSGVELRALSQYLIRVCSVITLFLGARFVILSLVVMSVTGKFFLTLVVCLMWFSETLLASSIAWFRATFDYIRAALSVVQGLTGLVVNSAACAFVLDNRAALFVEPDGTVNQSWQFMYSALGVYVAMSLMAIVAQLVAVGAAGVYYLSPRLGRNVPAPANGTGYEEILNLADDDIAPLWMQRHWPWLARTTPTRNKVLRAAVWVPLLVALMCVMAGLVELMILETGSCEASDGSCYSQCDPLDTTACLFPFPSSFYLEQDVSTQTGFRVAFPTSAMPVMRSRKHVDPTYWNELDGFSTVGPLLFNLPGATMLGVPNPPNREAAFASPAVKTVILDAATGVRHPHTVEINIHTGNGTDAVIILQPSVPMKHSTRYVVGVKGFVSAKGATLPANPGFGRLLAGIPAARAQHYVEQVYPVLDGAGFSNTSQLQLAWDFVTVSVNNSLGRAESARDAAAAAIPEGGPAFRVSKVQRESCGALEPATQPRVIWGYFTVPFFMRSKFRGSFFPRQNGPRPPVMQQTETMEAGFVVILPCSLLGADSPQADAIVQYGHGLLGSRREATTLWLRKMAHEYKWVVVATDMYGMSLFDLLPMVRILLSDIGRFATVPESTVQGYINYATLLRAVSDGALGASLVNPVTGNRILRPNTTVAYYGNSQGSVVGGGYAAMSTQLQKVVLGVPGSPFSLILFRSLDFDTYMSLLELCLYSGTDILLSIGLIQQLWDMGASDGWLHFMNQDLRPGTVAKTVLLQDGYGDAQVSTLGARVMARSFGAHTLHPQFRAVFGVEEVSGPVVDTSVLMEWNYTFVDYVPEGDVPPPMSTDTHECVRNQPAGMRQVGVFVRNGTVAQFCGEAGCVSDVCCAEENPAQCAFP